MVPRRVWIALVFSSLALSGCDSGTGPELIRTKLEVESAIVSAGDEIELRVIATNLGHRTVELNGSCGTPFVLEVQSPNGSRTFLLRDVPSICALSDHHVLEPGKTDMMTLRWTAPEQTGRYRLRAWARLQDRLGAASPEVTIEVE